MLRLINKIIAVLTMATLFVQCAQIGTLGGGQRDLVPPKLVDAIPKNKSIDINTGTILLTFDEYVQFKNQDQLIINPQLKTNPEVVAEGKTLKINFKREELLPSTTYRFLFGACIADMHEGNVLKDFEFVFSTGALTDSLQIKGQVLEAFNNSPVNGALVGLYDSNLRSDSLPYKYKPLYITKTDAAGNFIFTYLPHRTFEVYAINDNNKNNLYDGDVEKAAFYGPGLNLFVDTTLKLRMFQEEAPKTFIKKINSPYYGFGQIILNKKSKVVLSALNPEHTKQLMEVNMGMEKDTIAFYYKGLKDTLDLILKINGKITSDTLKIALPAKNPKSKIKNINTNISAGILELNQKLRLNFPTCMDTLIKPGATGFKIKCKEDSLTNVINAKGKWISELDYEFDYTFKEGNNYSVKMDSSIFKDLVGRKNDSNLFLFRCRNKADFGKVNLKIKLNRKQNYIIQLINEQQKVVREKFLSLSLSSSNAVDIDFIDVLPGSYSLKVIYDNNENKKWDGGDLLIKKLPEQVFISQKQLKVLADWEIEEEILVKD